MVSNNYLAIDQVITKLVWQNFKERFSSYAKIQQPKITAIDFHIDLYPEQQRFEAKGSYWIQNKYDQPIDTLLIKTGFDEISTFQLAVPYELVDKDTFAKFYVLKLKQPLASNDSLSVQFTIQNTNNTLFERNSNILSNGTFLKSDAFPRIGYPSATSELTLKDSTNSMFNYQTKDADLVRMNFVVSTSSEQTAIAPGRLLKQWNRNRRAYFHYQPQRPIKFSFGINSGIFECTQVKWQGVQVEVYHHPAHHWKVSQMIEGLKSSLSYNQKHFGPYQHEDIRIIEFPQSEGTFATTYANNIPTSEIRFIAQSDSSDKKTDFAFYVPVHELTHQWWGAQLIPRHSLGAPMLAESITEYITLMQYKNAFGTKKALNFLKLQCERYLRGHRSIQKSKEYPLGYAKHDQTFVAYGKGAMAFHSMSYLLGEDSLNQILAKFLDQYRFQEAPYPSSTELIQKLYQAMPDSLQYVVTDWFYKKVIYQYQLDYSQKTDQSDLVLNLELIKEHTDFNGNSTQESFQEWAEIGILYQNQPTYTLQKVPIQSGMNTIQLATKGAVLKVVFDPNQLLLKQEKR